MEQQNYILAESFYRPNIRNRLYYAMTPEDMETLRKNENLQFGDKVLVLTTKITYICGNDGLMYEI